MPGRRGPHATDGQGRPAAGPGPPRGREEPAAGAGERGPPPVGGARRARKTSPNVLVVMTFCSPTPPCQIARAKPWRLAAAPAKVRRFFPPSRRRGAHQHMKPAPHPPPRPLPGRGHGGENRVTFRLRWPALPTRVATRNITNWLQFGCETNSAGNDSPGSIDILPGKYREITCPQDAEDNCHRFFLPRRGQAFTPEITGTGINSLPALTVMFEDSFIR